MKKILITLFLAVFTFGCTSTTSVEENQEIEPSLSLISSSSMSDFPWIILNKVDAFRFKIDESSPVWHFDSGTSYFAAFEFSEQSGRVRIALSSNMNNRRVFAPQVSLLDENFSVVKTLGIDEFNIRFSDAMTKNRYTAEWVVDTDKTPYMMVYTDIETIGETVVIPHPAKVRAEESGEPMPIVTDLKYRRSYTGELDMEVETLSLSSYKRKLRQAEKRQAESVSQKRGVHKPTEPALDETKVYYHSAIKQAVESGDIPKALKLLDEAKTLNVDGAQKVFVEAVNNKK